MSYVDTLYIQTMKHAWQKDKPLVHTYIHVYYVKVCVQVFIYVNAYASIFLISKNAYTSYRTFV
jgi:hypothetical protein